jgi:hypothetical protein
MRSRAAGNLREQVWTPVRYSRQAAHTGASLQPTAQRLAWQARPWLLLLLLDVSS